MKIRRKLAGLSAAAIVLSTMTVPVSFAAGGFADTSGHWGESSITRWSDYGIVKGVDGTHFKPDHSMTRAQMATILANLLGLETKIENPFSDVQAGTWYEDAILQCAAAGIMKGTSDTTAHPNATITREQASVMLARALGIAEETGSNTFADAGQIADWAAGAVKAMADRGIVNGVGDNKFAPKANITRAAVAAILDRSITAYANKSGSSLEAAGSGITLVAAPDVTITGSAKDMIVAPGAKGVTTLKDATVSGALTMQAAKGTLELAGTTTVTDLKVPQGTEAATVTVQAGASVGTLSAAAPSTKLNIEGKADQINLADSAANSIVTVAKEATVGTLTSAADNVQVEGNGKLKDVVIASGKGVAIAASVSVDKITNNSADSVSHGKKVIAGKTPSTAKKTTGSSSGGGGGGGGSYHPGGDSPGSDGPSDPGDKDAPVDTPITGIKTASELEAALDDLDTSKKHNVTITVASAGDNNQMTAADPVELDIPAHVVSLSLYLNGANLGDVQIHAPESTTNITLANDSKTADDESAAEPSFSSLTIDAPGATVTNSVPVVNAVTVEGVSDSSFHQNARAGRIIMAGKGRLVVGAQNSTPTDGGVPQQTPIPVQVNAPESDAVILSGTLGEIAVNTAANVTIDKDLSANAKPKISSIDKDANLTVETDKPVAISGAVNTISVPAAADAAAQIELSGATVQTIDAPSTSHSATITGTGNVGTLTVAKDVTLGNIAVNQLVVDDKATTAAIKPVTSGTGAAATTATPIINEVRANAPVALNTNVDKVTVPDTVQTKPTITVAVNVVVSVVETNADITVAGAGTIANLTANPGSQTITVTVQVSTDDNTKPTITVAATTGATPDSLDLKDSSGSAAGLPQVQTKSIAPNATEVSFEEPTAAGGKGKIKATNTTNLTYSTNKAAETWSALSGTAMDVEPGTYYVRREETGKLPSEPISGIIPKAIGVISAQISGTPVYGQTLTAIANADATGTISYVWQADGTAIPNQTSRTLLLNSDDWIGKAISVKISNYSGQTTTGSAQDTATSTPTATVSTNKTALLAAIKQAEAIQQLGIIGSDAAPADIPEGVTFVPAALMTDLEAKLTAAKAAESATSQATVNTAAKELKTAVDAVNSSPKQVGTGATAEMLSQKTAELTQAITDAQALATSYANKTSVNGKDIKPADQWVTAAALDTFKQAITAAQNADKATVAAVTSALKALNQAQVTFTGTVQNGVTIDTTNLLTAISAARLNLSSVETSADGSDQLPSAQWVTQAAYDQYQKAINDAAEATFTVQNDVDARLTTLNTATETFNTAKKIGNGTGGDTPTPSDIVSDAHAEFVPRDYILGEEMSLKVSFTSKLTGTYWLVTGGKPSVLSGTPIKAGEKIALDDVVMHLPQSESDAHTLYIRIREPNGKLYYVDVPIVIPDGYHIVKYYVFPSIYPEFSDSIIRYSVLVKDGKTLPACWSQINPGHKLKGWYIGTVNSDNSVTLASTPANFETDTVTAETRVFAQWEALTAKTEAELREALQKEEAKELRIYVEDSMTLTSDLEIPSGVGVAFLNGKTLTIPAGITLTNNGNLVGGIDAIKDPTSIVIEGSLVGSSSSLNGGSFSGRPLHIQVKSGGTFAANKGLQCDTLTVDEGSTFTFSDASIKDFTMNGSLTIPEGVTLTLQKTAVIGTTAKPVNVTVNGKLYIDTGANATIYGDLQNNGVVEAKKDATLTVTGTTSGNPVVSNPTISVKTAEELRNALDNNEGNKWDITVDDSFTVSDSVYVPQNCWLTISAGNTLTFPANASLGGSGTVDLNGNLVFDGDHTLAITIEGGDEATITVNGNFTNADYIRNISAVSVSGNLMNEGMLYSGILNVGGTITNKGFLDLHVKTADQLKTMLAKISNAGANSGQCDIFAQSGIQLDETITIPKGVYLGCSNLSTTADIINNGEWNISPEGNVTIQGNLQNNGKWNINSKGNMTIQGNLQNSGSVNVEEEATLTVTGTTSGNPIVYHTSLSVKTPEELRDALNNNKNNIWNITVDSSFTALGSVDVPQGCKFTVSADNTLTLPANATLSGDGDITLNGNLVVNGDFTISKFFLHDSRATITVNGNLTNTDQLSGYSKLSVSGDLINNGWISVNMASGVKGTLNVQGSITGTGSLEMRVATADQVKTTLAKVANIAAGGGRCTIGIYDDIELDETITTIPEGVTLSCEGNWTLSTAVNVDITNNGTISTMLGTISIMGNLTNNGEIRNFNMMSIAGNLTNNGKINNMRGTLEVAGTVTGDGTVEGNAIVQGSANSNAVSEPVEPVQLEEPPVEDTSTSEPTDPETPPVEDDTNKPAEPVDPETPPVEDDADKPAESVEPETPPVEDDANKPAESVEPETPPVEDNTDKPAEPVEPETPPVEDDADKPAESVEPSETEEPPTSDTDVVEPVESEEEPSAETPPTEEPSEGTGEEPTPEPESAPTGEPIKEPSPSGNEE